MRYAPFLLLILAAAGTPQDAPATNDAGRPLVYIIPVEGEVNYSLAAFIKRSVAEAEAKNADMILLEIDTPGGYVGDMLKISSELVSSIISESRRPVVAFIRPRGKEIMGGAYSAGALISLSCKKIYMYPASVIGAAAPVGGDGKEVGEKYVSAFRTKFAAVAEQNGYPKNLAIAMVDKDWEVYEAVVDGKKEYLTMLEIEELKGQGKTMTLSSYPVVEKGKILTLTVKEAIKYGIATGETTSRKEIYDQHGIRNPREVEVQYSWSEDLVNFLQSPGISMLLSIIGILGIWIAFQAGMITPGIVGVTAFAILISSNYLIGLADVAEIALIVVGLILIGLEIFVIPGFGIAGIAGILCFIAGLVLSNINFTLPTGSYDWEILGKTIGATIIALGVAAAGALMIIRFLPHVPLFKRLELRSAIDGTSVGDASAMPLGGHLLGRMGTAETILRPSGKIAVDGITIDVVAEGNEFINRGERVKIVHVEGARIVVTRVTPV